MTKRSNPFDESTPMQLKTRVSEKLVNIGVASPENMNAIYEKTKNLLFAGASNFVNNNNNNMAPHSNTVKAPPHPFTFTLQQKQTGAGGDKVSEQLSLNNNKTTNTQDVSMMASGVTPARCVLCQARGGNELRKLAASITCSFCEKAVCVQCSQQCYQCSGTFCILCSMINYDCIDERPICVSCLE